MKTKVKYVESLQVAPTDILLDDQEIDEQIVADIVASIRKGAAIINPVIVRRLSNRKLKIVAGRHRVRAAIRAKLNAVPVRVVESDEAGLALIELDENVVRRHLTPAAEAKLVGKRDALMLKSGVASKALRDKAVAAEMGVSDRKARRARTRANALDNGLLEKLAKTSLRWGVELDALIALDDVTRFELIERAIAGEDVSAKKVRAEMEAREDALLKAKAPAGLGGFCSEWRKLDKPTALRALEWLRAEVGMTYAVDRAASYEDFAPAFETVDVRAAIELNNAQ